VKKLTNVSATGMLACLIFFAPIENLSAQAVNPAQCDADIGGTVPAFRCSLGELVHDNVDSLGNPIEASICNAPEQLNNRCVNYSYLGRLDSGNPAVDVIFSCRPSQSHQPDSNRLYNDIAAIQYNRETGATCFYQHLREETTENEIIPAANSPEGRAFFDYDTTFCSECHSNNAFIRTPHYNSAGVLPNINSTQPYHISSGNRNAYLTYTVTRGDNSCTACHTIGAFSFDNGTTKRIGHTNYVAAGTHQSLFENGPAPTSTGYDDYMAMFVGGRDNAIAELSKLEECLGSSPPFDCNVTLTSQQNVTNGAPTAPGNLRSDLLTNPPRISLTWDASQDPDSDLITYAILRNNELYIQLTETNFVDYDVSPGSTYTYTVVANDSLNQSSSPSNSVTLTVSDSTVPPATQEIELQLNQAYSGNVAENELLYFKVFNATSLQLYTYSGDADLFVYADASRSLESEICASINLDLQTDFCDQLPSGKLYITVSGYFASEFEIIATADNVPPPVTEPPVTEPPVVEPQVNNNPEVVPAASNTEDSGSGSTSMWFIGILIVALRKRIIRKGYWKAMFQTSTR